MAASSLQIGDLVWAKKKGYAPWPAKVVEPTDDVKPISDKKPKLCVLFFATNKSEWIPTDQIWSYVEHREEFLEPSELVNPLFQLAVDEIEPLVKALPGYTELKPASERSTDKSADKEQAQGAEPGSEEQSSGAAAVPRKSLGDQRSSTRKRTIITPVQVTPVVQPKRSKPVSVAATPASHKGSAPKSATKGGAAPSKTNPPVTPARDVVKIPVRRMVSLHSLPPGAPQMTPARLLPDILSAPRTPADDPPLADEDRRLSVKVGFLGLGKLGSVLARCLIESGHDVTVWNRTPSKCREFVKLGAVKGLSPAEVVQACDITISCLSDSHALKDLVSGSGGLLQDMGPGKSFVDMSTVDVDTISEVHRMVTVRGGRFLEAPVIGSLHSDQADSSQLIIVAAGDQTLYDDCHSCFSAITKRVFYIGEVGSASCMKLVANALLGTMLAGIAECLALGEKVGLRQDQILEIIALLPLNCALYALKGNAMIHNEFNPPQLSLEHMQRDLKLSIGLAESVEQPVHVTSATNELFKRARARGYGDHDTAAIYRATE